MINGKGLDLIKKYESFSAKPYVCPAGELTIGYGHVIKDHENIKHLTPEQADELLIKDISVFEEEVRPLIEIDLNENQYAAIIAFVYNIGITQFRSSTLLKLLNDDKILNVPEQFLRWIYCNKKPLKGLLNRRLAEVNLFCED